MHIGGFAAGFFGSTSLGSCTLPPQTLAPQSLRPALQREQFRPLAAAVSMRILDRFRRWAARALIATTGIVSVGVMAGAWLLSDRPSLDVIDWPALPVDEPPAEAVTVIWFGVSTLLFDDGETQLLIDGFFSRPSLADIVFGIPVESDAPQINRVIDEYRMQRLAAIIPVHSHFDHAMDIGAIANRSNASVLGSETTAQIARGAGVPDDQIIVAEANTEYAFGRFRVTLIGSLHAPVGWGGSVPFAGTLDAPLHTPAPVSSWVEGNSYSIIVAHDQGTTLIQGSAGFLEGVLDQIRADVVLLGVAGLSGLGQDYTESYWQSLVTATGAKRVLPIHFEDFSQPFGEIWLAPHILDDFIETAKWLEATRRVWDTTTQLQMPEFGKAILLYPLSAPEA